MIWFFLFVLLNLLDYCFLLCILNKQNIWKDEKKTTNKQTMLGRNVLKILDLPKFGFCVCVFVAVVFVVAFFFFVVVVLLLKKRRWQNCYF